MSVLVPLDQISETKVPKVVSERVALFQTAVGIVRASEDEALRIEELVFELIAV